MNLNIRRPPRLVRENAFRPEVDRMDPQMPSMSAEEATRRVFGDRGVVNVAPAPPPETDRAPPPATDRGGRRTRKRRGGMYGTKTGDQIQFVNSGLGAPGGLTIRAPANRILFGDETPPPGTAVAVSPPQQTRDVSKGIVGTIGENRVTVGKLNLPSGGKTRRNTTSGGDIVIRMLTIRNQIKLYHWQTREFARHTATDALTAALDTNIDAFVESYMGRYGRPKVRGSIKLHNFSESAAKAFVAKETKYLERDLPRTIGKGDSDLLNIRDEILGELTKVSYLFTLN